MDMKWQEHEVQAMTALRKSGVSFPIIAKILQRPIVGIQQKAHKIGLVYGGRSEENQEESALKTLNLCLAFSKEQKIE